MRRRYAIFLILTVWGAGAGCGGAGSLSDATDLRHCSEPVTPTIDWHDCDKRRVNLSDQLLSGADLSGANLSGADLSGARIIKVNMDGTDLTDANLEGAFFSGGYPQGATFCRTTMPDGTVQSSGCK